jgi:hypothetical protein
VMNFLAQAAAKAEARFTEALNKVDSAAAPALEKAKDRLEETTSQIAEKVTEKANELGLKDLGLGVGDRQPTQPPVPRQRGDDSSAERPKGVVAAGSEALAREAVDKIVEAKHHSDMTHAETRARRFNDGERNRLAEEKNTDASSETTPPPVSSRDAPAATEGSDAGGVIEDLDAAVPTPDPSVPAPLDDSPAEPEPEPPRKKTALELLKERRTAREAAAANAKGVIVGLIPDPPKDGPPRQLPRRSSPRRRRPPTHRPTRPHSRRRETQRRNGKPALLAPNPTGGTEGGTPAFAAANATVSAERELGRRVKRVALLAHARALRQRRVDEAREADARCERAGAALESRRASSGKVKTKAELRAKEAANELERTKAEHVAAREAAEERVAALAGAGGERARKLAAEQRRLAAATSRRDDATDEAEHFDRTTRELRRRIVAANRRSQRAEETLAKKRSAKGIGNGAASDAELAALEERLRTLREANAAAADRNASSAESASNVPDVSAADATDQLALDAAFRSATEALIAEQTRAEALASERSALVFRLETAKQIADERVGRGSRGDGYVDEEAGAVESAAVGYRGHIGGYDSDDDAGEVLSETGRYAPKQLAYDIASKALGGGERARRVSNLVGAVDALALEGLRAAGRHGVARAGAVAYLCVLHLYMFALLFFGGSGPRATSTATMTAESLYPKP